MEKGRNVYHPCCIPPGPWQRTHMGSLVSGFCNPGPSSLAERGRLCLQTKHAILLLCYLGGGYPGASRAVCDCPCKLCKLAGLGVPECTVHSTDLESVCYWWALGLYSCSYRGEIVPEILHDFLCRSQILMQLQEHTCMA